LARPEAKNISGKGSFVILWHIPSGNQYLTRPVFPLAAIALLVISSGITMVQYSDGSMYSNYSHCTHLFFYLFYVLSISIFFNSL
jgi:hypothetical protein